MVFRTYAVLVNASLTALPHGEVADPIALVNSLQVDETILEASLDLYHLLLHFTTRPALDKVTRGDGEPVALVARWDPKLRSRSAGILLELMRFLTMTEKSTSEPC